MAHSITRAERRRGICITASPLPLDSDEMKAQRREFVFLSSPLSVSLSVIFSRNGNFKSRHHNTLNRPSFRHRRKDNRRRYSKNRIVSEWPRKSALIKQ